MLSNQIKSVAFLLLFSCIMVMPVYSQEIEPTPTPRPTTNTIISEFSEAVENNSSALNILVMVVVVLGAIVVLMVMVGWKALQPLIQSNIDANKRAAEAQQAVIEWQRNNHEREEKVNETRKLQADSLQKTSLSLDATAKFMSEIETRKEAQENRKLSVGEVNTHTDSAVLTLKNALDQAVNGINEVKDELQHKLTKDDLNNGLRPIMEKLNAIALELASIQDNPVNTPVAKIDAVVELKESINEENKPNE